MTRNPSKSQAGNGTFLHAPADAMAFVRAFVGAVGPGAEAMRQRAAWAGLGTCAEAALGESGRLWSFGETRATLADDALVGRSWIRGRPFALRQDLAGIELSRALPELDGRYCVCGLDSAGVLTLATDLLGCGGIFYARQGDTCYFASHLGLLLTTLPRMPELDRLGVTCVLCTRASVDGLTPFQGVRRLSEAEFLQLSPAGAEIASGRYADLADMLCPAEVVRASQEAREARFTELLQSSVGRELAALPHPGLMLSAGRDSGAIAMAVGRVRPERAHLAATFGETGSTDVEGARVAAERLGLAHRTVAYDHWKVEDYAPLIVGIGGGMSGLQVAHMAAGFDAASAYFPSTLVGFMGDSVSGSRLSAAGTPLRRRSFIERRVMFAGMLREPALRRALAPQIDEVYDRLSSRTDAFGDVGTHNQHLLLHLSVTQGSYMSSSFELCESFMEIGYPFYSRALIRFMLSLPPGLLNEQRFYRRWYQRQCIGESPRGTASVVAARLSERVAELTKLSVFRLIGPRTQRRPPERLDWSARIERSQRWFKSAAEVDCGDGLLNDLARNLSGGGGGKHFPPSLLFLLPPLLATRIQSDSSEAALATRV